MKICRTFLNQGSVLMSLLLVPFLHESPSEFNGKSTGTTDIWPPYIRNFVIISRTEEEFDKGFSNSLKQN